MANGNAPSEVSKENVSENMVDAQTKTPETVPDVLDTMTAQLVALNRTIVETAQDKTQKSDDRLVANEIAKAQEERLRLVEAIQEELRNRTERKAA